jgi:3-methyladenine DNA glycosylase AlkD
MLTFALIRIQKFGPTKSIARDLLNDKHDLIHKAVGWMLREMGNRDKQELIQFLDQHKNQMPRTMLRYAIEKFSPEERKAYLAK